MRFRIQKSSRFVNNCKDTLLIIGQLILLSLAVSDHSSSTENTRVWSNSVLCPYTQQNTGLNVSNTIIKYNYYYSSKDIIESVSIRLFSIFFYLLMAFNCKHNVR